MLLPGVELDAIPAFLRGFTYIDLRDQSPETIDDAIERIGRALTPEEAERPYSPRIFLCHAKEDAARVEELYFSLGKAGFDPWYDKQKLLIGDHWEDEIKVAISQTDFFAICLSQVSATKKGFIQKEIRDAVDEYRKRPQGTVFLLPIRLEECSLLDIKLDETTVLSDLHWFDLFEGDDSAIEELAEAIWKQWRKSRSE